MSGTHALIAPSSLGLTVACNASVSLQAAIPPLPETDEEAEGTAAHIVAGWAASGVNFEFGQKFTSGGRDWLIDIDMYNGAKLYAKALGGFSTFLRVEDAVKCSRIHPEHCRGTPDAWRYFPEGTAESNGLPLLRVGDYKYGFRYVEVFENYQLLAYAVGVMERLGLSDNEGLMLEFILVQPRSYHRDGPVKIWRALAQNVRGLVNIANSAAHAALGPDPIARTGNHCIDCRARHRCATLQQSTASIVDFSSVAELQPDNPVAMGNELHTLDAAIARLQARRTGLAVAVDAVLRAGQRTPWYELQPARSNLKWKEGATPELIRDMGELFGVRTIKPLEPITPRQAIDAGIDESVIVPHYAERPPAHLVVKPTDTKAVDKVFNQKP